MMADTASSPTSPKELKKQEKARLAAEKKAKKEAEKQAKKAEKERLAAEKKAAKAAKAAKKKGRPASVTSEASAAVTDGSGDSGVATAGGAADKPSLPSSGAGLLARAWIAAHPGEELGSPAIVVDPAALDDTEHFNNLGEGVFGMVYECGIRREGVDRLRDAGDADADATAVVKKLAADASEAAAAEFAAEAVAMERLDHPNVLRILGSVMGQEPKMLVFEGHPHGVLQTYLRACKTTGRLSDLLQVRMGRDVAAGLDYLHSLGSVHGDLAARNCLVSADDVVRIGDFGLSRIKFPTDYHEVDFCGEPLPLRWMAPESLSGVAEAAAAGGGGGGDGGNGGSGSGSPVFTSRSDVWSAGVVLWEISTHGIQPFAKLASGEVAAEILRGATNVALKGCHQGLASAIAQCQSTEPEARPTAAALCETLSALMETIADAGDGADAKVNEEDAGSEYDAETLTNRKILLDKIAAAADPSAAAAANGGGGGKAGKGSPGQNRFNKLKNNKKSFRALGRFKEADNPSEAMEEVTGQASKAVELDRSLITLGDELGQGAFGVVVRGRLARANGTAVPCACKTLKDRGNAEDLDALEAEAELVSAFDHENVVKCFGKVTVGDPAMIVFEFMSNGSLLSYLQKLPEAPKLQRLMKIAIDIAKGMAYLAEGNNVHRDLATRNVLVNEELTCKISDFGLSRDLADDDTYYESEGGMVPIRWTPPEAYKYKKYSTASDVWSYGITLYEVWTKGGLPYGRKWTNMNVMMEVEKGYRLPAPPKCPKAVYQLMLKCWNPLRRMRPKFASIREQLQMAYDMMFPPEDVAAAADDEPEIDTEYGDMDQMYYGMDVPTEDNLDTYVDNPTPVEPPAPPPALPPRDRSDSGSGSGSGSEAAGEPPKLGVKAAAELLKSELGGGGVGDPPSSPVFVGKNVEQKPDRFAHLLKGTPPPAKAGGTGSADSSNSGSPITRRKAGGPASAQAKSLRKQRAASVEDPDEAEASGAKVRVADVINLSKVREEQSAAELTGIAKLQKAGVPTPMVEPNAYAETVGRAVEGVQEVKVGKRKRCVCRRFKCVCGAK